MTEFWQNDALIAVVGPTGSGKTALSLQIAQQYNGEIICADSRTVYRGMDIGTAKPIAAERGLIPHHLLDVVTPDQRFSVADFQRLANQAITDIRGRGKLPVVVGGTGLYVDALLYDYSLRPPADPALHQELEKLNDDELRARLDGREIVLGQSDRSNRQRLIRALETDGLPSRKSHHLPSGTLMIGLTNSAKGREERLRARFQAMLATGLMREAAGLMERYGSGAPGLTGIYYPTLARVAGGEITAAEATEACVRGDVQLSKRQMTWFKRNPDIHWAATPAQALQLAGSFLAKAV